LGRILKLLITLSLHDRAFAFNVGGTTLQANHVTLLHLQLG